MAQKWRQFLSPWLWSLEKEGAKTLRQPSAADTLIARGRQQIAGCNDRLELAPTLHAISPSERQVGPLLPRNDLFFMLVLVLWEWKIWVGKLQV